MLITTIGCRPHSSALVSTNRVCGMGPSAASTSTSAPSAIRRTALDLAAEIGVAGRVDEIDLHVLVVHGDVLGEDRDAPLALQFVGIEDAIADQLAGAELAALPEQAIDQRRLAVVDVGDDGDIADVVATHGFKYEV